IAFASFPARHGQQRSLARIFHALSCAFARSPRARSFAWARLASFCGSGLFRPLYGVFAQVLPWYPLSARVTRPAFSNSSSTPQIHSAFLSCTEPGSAQCQELKGRNGLATLGVGSARLPEM